MGMAFTMASTIFGIYSQNKALEAQGHANLATARSMVTSMNYSLQNLEQERRDIFEATVQELERTQLQGRRLTSSVSAAVSEGLQGGGRTANLLVRSAEADTHRAMASVKDNYQKKSNEVDLNKEATLMNTKAQIRSIRDVQKPSLLGTIAQLGTAYLGARQEQEKINLMRKQAGVGQDKPPMGAGGVHFAWDAADKIYKASYQPFSFQSLLGDIDHKQTKFTFNVPNPFSQDKQSINYF
jgi:hypothetical protein|nr:MAG TPA: putative internal virion protein B [Caudoviricetes sp.]